MVNVTKPNFIEESNDFIRRLPSAAFVALDEEMTGIVIPNSDKPTKDQTPDERYEMLKNVPEKYSIIQLGICLFHEHPEYQAGRGHDLETPQFIARKYNFWMFPPADLKITREVVLNPSSVSFLNQHNMNFDVWTKQGVPFVTSEQAEDLIKLYQNKQSEIQENKDKKRSNAFRAGRRSVELRRTEDINFHARAMASLREWLDSAQPMHVRGRNGVSEPVQEGLSFLLPPTSSFMRRAFYESIGAEYPSLILENAGPNFPNQIRVLRLNPTEQRMREERLMRESWEELIVNQIGVWRVFMALSLACHGLEIPTDSITFAPHVNRIDWARGFECVGNLERTGRCVPLVVHNGYMDLMFLLSHFHSHQLPAKFADAKYLIHSYFPHIYDTKLLVTECAPPSWADSTTHLEHLFAKIYHENEEMGGLVELVVERNSYGQIMGGADNAHDASYDAFMTGCVYAGMCHYIAAYERFPRDIILSPGPNNRVGSLTHLLSNGPDERVRSLFGRNKLYLMQSIYTIDLENEDDPLYRGMIPESVFRITNFDPSVSTRTIMQWLSEIVDSSFHHINYELWWCSETRFIVGATRKPLPRSQAEVNVLREHGRLIFEVLKGRFTTAAIVSWAEYTAKPPVDYMEERGAWSSSISRFFYRLLGWPSVATKPVKAGKRELEEVLEQRERPFAKRRRIR